MEEKSDSTEEILDNQKEPVKKSSLIDSTEKNLINVNNLNSKNNVLEANNKNTNNEIINKNEINSTQKDINNNKVNDKGSKPVLNEINKVKTSDRPDSANVSNIKPKKEVPIEKKPFNEFIEDHLLPSLIKELKERGLEVTNIKLKNTSRPIAGDKCWVISCEIKDICNFWLSFEKNDISSPKSISLCKSDQKPSVIESFLIDEKKITLKLIISRILQRLNGQKLLGFN